MIVLYVPSPLHVCSDKASGYTEAIEITAFYAIFTLGTCTKGKT